MKNETELTVRINESTINTVIKNGNKLVPLTDMMKALYGNAFRRETDAIKPEIAEYIQKVGSKRYVTLMGLSPILSHYGDKALQESVIHQVLHLPKHKKDPVEALYDGIVCMSNVNNLIKQISEEIHSCDFKRGDLLHALENNDFTEKEMAKVASQLKFISKRRRDFKNRQKMLDDQITWLKEMGFKGSSEAGRAVQDLAKTRAELERCKKHGIYFNRDGSNKEEMEQKIRELTA